MMWIEVDDGDFCDLDKATAITSWQRGDGYLDKFIISIVFDDRSHSISFKDWGPMKKKWDWIVSIIKPNKEC